MVRMILLNGGRKLVKAIRQKLHQFIDSIEEKKAKAIYVLFEEEIEQNKRIDGKQYNKEIDEAMTRVAAGKFTTQVMTAVSGRTNYTITELRIISEKNELQYYACGILKWNQNHTSSSQLRNNSNAAFYNLVQFNI